MPPAAARELAVKLGFRSAACCRSAPAGPGRLARDRGATFEGQARAPHRQRRTASPGRRLHVIEDARIGSTTMCRGPRCRYRAPQAGVAVVQIGSADGRDGNRLSVRAAVGAGLVDLGDLDRLLGVGVVVSCEGPQAASPRASAAKREARRIVACSLFIVGRAGRGGSEAASVLLRRRAGAIRMFFHEAARRSASTPEPPSTGSVPRLRPISVALRRQVDHLYAPNEQLGVSSGFMCRRKLCGDRAAPALRVRGCPPRLTAMPAAGKPIRDPFDRPHHRPRPDRALAPLGYRDFRLLWSATLCRISAAWCRPWARPG